MDPLGSLGSLGSTRPLEILWKSFGNPLGTLWSPLVAPLGPEGRQEETKGRPRGSQKDAWEPLGFLGSTLDAIWDSLETLWKPIGNALGPLGSSIGSQMEARVVQRGAKGRPTEARVVQRDAKGRPREAKRTLGRLPWEHLGASLVKEDFGSNTSKLAEAFDEK